MATFLQIHMEPQKPLENGLLGILRFHVGLRGGARTKWDLGPQIDGIDDL